MDWAFGIGSLTMTYFHTGIRTIIGAEAFHCPVRDGKEWSHLAMVVRQNFLSFWHFGYQEDQFIELISCLFDGRVLLKAHGHILNASTWHNFPDGTLGCTSKL
jgi:hypothetical protein